ncbi:MAG: TetR/AcrR family transcriptional regulator [Gammaproteobacteria bacterium]|nr:TetR/AcrR family transcriptional regulator [Gammaproteobacteria bacterium]
MIAEHEHDKGGKRAQVLNAAQNVFLREGFESASMEAIASEAGVSKQTIYNHFGGKEDLFRAMVEHRCAVMGEELDKGILAHGDDVEQVLVTFGQNLLDVMLSPEAMWMKRLLQSEGSRHPQLAEAFYRLGADATAHRLAGYLEEQNRKGSLAVRDPRIAAEQFASMLPGHLRLRHLIGLAAPPTREECRRRVVNAVQLFLEGARPRTERRRLLRSGLLGRGRSGQ